MRPESREKKLDAQPEVQETAFEREERMMWESLQAGGFKFSTEKKKGNAIAGRWDRVMQSENQWSEKYMKAEGYPAKKEIRQEWAKWEFHKWEKRRSFEKSVGNTKSQKMKGVYM
eukprot:620273-Pyramimonas_sp.AAC.1